MIYTIETNKGGFEGDSIEEIIALAEENISSNPTITEVTSYEVAERYTKAIAAEAAEVLVEVKENNAVYLADELGDIFWTFMQLVVLSKERGLISSVDEVFEAAVEKYKERMPAFLERDNTKWDKIKSVQKERMAMRHKEKYES